MPTLRIPVVGSPINRLDSNTFTGDQLFTNGIPDVTRNPITGKSAVYLMKRPGTAKGAALTGVDSAAKSGAILNWSGQTGSTPKVVAAFLNTGGTSTSIWDIGLDTKIGGDISTTDDCTCITETIVSGTPNLVANFYDSSTTLLEQWFFPEGGAWTQVTDGDFPSNVVGQPAHMDGYVFNMTADGKVYNSDLNSVSSYTANNFVSAGQYPDRGITVARHGAHIIAFGECSIERFYNNGNASGSPLSRVEDGGLLMGAARTRTVGGVSKITYPSVLTAYGTIYWLGTNSQGAPQGIYRFKGTTPEKISNTTIDRMLSGGAVFGFGGTAFLCGTSHVLLRTAQDTYAYQIETGMWWRLKLASGAISGCVTVRADFAFASTDNYFIGTNNARGNHFQPLPSSINHQDDGSNYTLTVQTASDDLGTSKRKFYESLRLIGDDPTAACNVSVSYSDDDYATFSTARNIDMNTYPSPKLTRLGSSLRRAWKLANTSATALRLEALEIDYSVGQS